MKIPFIAVGENPNIKEFLTILLEKNHDLANSPTSKRCFLSILLPHILQWKSCNEYSPRSINVISAWFGSVAHEAARIRRLDALK